MRKTLKRNGTMLSSVRGLFVREEREASKLRRSGLFPLVNSYFKCDMGPDSISFQLALYRCGALDRSDLVGFFEH